jgi:gas vesicle protein
MLKIYNMKKSKNNAFFLLTGAILGAAATYYLHTPKGKKLRKKFSEVTDDLTTEISTNTKKLADNMKESYNESISSASNTIDSISESLEEVKTNGIEIAENKIGSFKDGIQKAKMKLSNND